MSTVSIAAGAPPRDRVELAGVIGLLVFVGALQLSIAVAGIVLAFSIGCWALFATLHHESVGVPRFFWPLLVYAALTLLSAAASYDSAASFVDSKQLVLFLIVPMVYQFGRGTRAMTVVQVVITVGAASAAWGIVQYGLFNYNNLGQRPQGALGHYMTYSGLLLLVVGAAVARLLFEPGEPRMAGGDPAGPARRARAHVHPECVGGRLCRRGAAARDEGLPPAAASFRSSPRRSSRISPPQITARFYSIFDLKDPTSRDRVAMLHEGVAHGQGAPAHGRRAEHGAAALRAVPGPDRGREGQSPPAQCADAHRRRARAAGTRRLAVRRSAIAIVDLARLLRRSRFPSLPATALAAIAGMLAAGLFEYNFGDSEFLMLFLVLVTLPFAAERPDLP